MWLTTHYTIISDSAVKKKLTIRLQVWDRVSQTNNVSPKNQTGELQIRCSTHWANRANISFNICAIHCLRRLENITGNLATYLNFLIVSFRLTVGDLGCWFIVIKLMAEFTEEAWYRNHIFLTCLIYNRILYLHKYVVFCWRKHRHLIFQHFFWGFTIHMWTFFNVQVGEIHSKRGRL